MANSRSENDGKPSGASAGQANGTWPGMKKISHMESPGEGAKAQTWLIGALKERGQDLICQPWAHNSGLLGMLAYQWNGSAMGMKTVNPGADDMGNDASAVAWVIADIDGDRADEVCQVIDFDGKGDDVRMIVYGLRGGQFVTLGHHSETGNGTPAVAWLAGNICHQGFKQSICQVWESGSQVGMTIWDWVDDTEGGEMVAIWNSFGVSDVERPDASLAWLIGDVNGDGLDEVIQVYAFEDLWIGMIVYGWVGDGESGHMQVISSKHGVITHTDGTSAVSWQIADINGDGRAEVIQMFETQDSDGLCSCVYGWQDEQGQMDFINDNLGLPEGPKAISWLAGDFNGDGRKEICQLWKNDIDMVGMAVYGWIDGNLEEIWRSDMFAMANALSWLAGDINGDSYDEICQQVEDGNGNLNIIVYGSAAT